MSSSELRPEIWRSVETLGPRARVALAIAIVERMTDVLRSRDGIVALLRKTSDAGRRWVWTSGVSANDVYQVIPTLLERVRDVASDVRLRHAMFAALSAIYYAVWEINRETPEAERAARPPLPGDVADVSIDTLRESLEYMNAGVPDGPSESWAADVVRQLGELECADGTLKVPHSIERIDAFPIGEKLR